MSKNVDDTMLYVHTEVYAFCKCLPTNVLAFLSKFYSGVCVFFFFNWERIKDRNLKYCSNTNVCITI